MQTQISPEQCQHAMQTRDARFDGKFFVGVTSTGIYCRPVCPAPRPKPENMRYFASAAAAASEGFRPCLRCRPESAPGSPAWKGSSTTVQRALGLIEAGALNDGTLEQLSDRLGVSSRHLNRLFHQHLGASPLAVAQTRRLHFAKKLLNETRLSMTDIALASGFGSVRRFNAAFRKTYDCPPTELRRMNGTATSNAVTLELSYRPPFDWSALLDFYAMRAVPGVEAVIDHCYHRTIRIGEAHGRFSVCPDDTRQTLKATIDFPDTAQLLHIVERIRRQFDLYADPVEIGRQLSQDVLLQPLIERWPGLRAPGAWDPFEMAVRAILGQQVSVKGARTLAGRLTERFGESLEKHPQPELCALFPTPAALADADISNLGMPKARGRAIQALAQAVCDGDISFAPGADVDALCKNLVELPGIGDWTAQYIAMRALGAPDAFPAADLGIIKALSSADHQPTPRELTARAEQWRPWRAYAVMYLWKSLELNN